MFIKKDDCYTLPGKNCDDEDLSSRENGEPLNPDDYPEDEKLFEETSSDLHR